MFSVEPWLPPTSPDLAILAMAAADDAGLISLRSWPEVRKSGIAYAGLPPFLCWRGRDDHGWHLVLLQAREVGALVPGARMTPLPEGWLESLDLDSLARPLARHPAFPGGASVHVVHLPGADAFSVRSHGPAAPEVVTEVLKHTSHIQVWNLAD